MAHILTFSEKVQVTHSQRIHHSTFYPLENRAVLLATARPCPSKKSRIIQQKQATIPFFGSKEWILGAKGAWSPLEHTWHTRLENTCNKDEEVPNLSKGGGLRIPRYSSLTNSASPWDRRTIVCGYIRRWYIYERKTIATNDTIVTPPSTATQEHQAASVATLFYILQ